MKWLSLPAALLVLATCSTANADLLDRLTRVFESEGSYEESYERATPVWTRGQFAQPYFASDAGDTGYHNYSGFHLGHGHAHAFGDGYGCDSGCTPSCDRGCKAAKPMFGCGKPSSSFKKPCGFGCNGECGSAQCRTPRTKCWRPEPKCCEPAGDCCGKKMNFQLLNGRCCKSGCDDAGCEPATCGCGKSKCKKNLFSGWQRGCGCGKRFGGCSSCDATGGCGHYHGDHYEVPANPTPTSEDESQEPSLLPMPPLNNAPEAPQPKSASLWLLPADSNVLPVGMDW